MIEGYFDPAGRPYVRAYVVVPGLQSAPEATALLLDTGADNTLIQPAGARILGIRTQKPEPDGYKQGNRRHDQLRHGTCLHRIPREAVALAKDQTGLLPDRTGSGAARP